MQPDFFVQLKEALNDLNDRLAKVEHTVNDVIINSLMEATDEYDYNEGLETFRSTYGDQLGPLEGKLKSLYGEDYDGAKDLYDTSLSHANDEGFDEASYVADQIAEVNAKLDALVDAVGAEEAPAEEVVEEESAEIPSEEQLMQELQNAE